MDDRLGTLLAACQVAGIAAASLTLPFALVDWLFGTELAVFLARAALVAFVCALIVATWKLQDR